MARPRTILQACTRVRGVHKGALTAAHVAQYAIATAELGEVPGTARYADYWAIDERTGWRHREGIREVFGDDWRAVVEQVAAEATKRQTTAPGRLLGVKVAA